MIRCCTRIWRVTCDANVTQSTRLLRPPEYSTVATAAERIIVPRGSNGSIILDVHYPLTAPPSSNNVPVIIYLPRGPLLADADQDISNVSVLRSTAACHVVKINYRLSSEHQYPTPVHDMLAGYDWIVENLLPKRAITRAGRSEHVGKLAVCGEFIGGGLATSLALTECRIGQPGIVAAAVNNPVVDWVSLSMESNPKRTGTTRTAGHEDVLNGLYNFKGRLFNKLEHYFDSFASPIHFFRSAGVDVPPAIPSPINPSDDMDELAIFARDEWMQREQALNDGHAVSEGDRGTKENSAPLKRKASRRFPGRSLGIRLPDFNITAGRASPILDQAQELTHVLRQSFARQSKHAIATSGFGRKVLMEGEEDQLEEDQLRATELQRMEAEQKGQLQVSNGLGLWDDSPDGRERVLAMSKWLVNKLQ